MNAVQASPARIKLTVIRSATVPTTFRTNGLSETGSTFDPSLTNNCRSGALFSTLDHDTDIDDYANADEENREEER